jgi:hypothetical protein
MRNAGESSTWFAGALGVSLARHAELSLRGGRTPPDFVRGIPGGRSLSLGLRLQTDPLPFVRAPRVRDDGGLRLLVARDGAGHVMTVRAPGATRVEVAGDFTDWSPVSLASDASGNWVLRAQLEPGVHRVRVRVDGGEWQVPPNLTRARDEFDGWVGILTVY